MALAAWAHRRSSVVLGLLVCATTGLIISPITWVHHMVWVVPVIIWLAVGADRPRRGPLLAAFTVVLFVAAPIWWVPTSWKVTKNPPELHQNYWQLLVGNSFLFAMLAFLAGVAIMLVRRSAESRLEDGVGVGGQLGPPVTIGTTAVAALRSRTTNSSDPKAQRDRSRLQLDDRFQGYGRAHGGPRLR